MLIKNALIENNEKPQDLRIENGVFTDIGKLEQQENEEVLDLKEKLLLPPFIESHVHLDTCLTAGDPCWNMSGTLFEGIECWSKRKEKLNPEDIRERVNKVVRMYAANGIQAIRTHVDVTDPKLMALKTILELKEELKDVMDLQIVAFPQEGILSYPNGKQLLIDAVKMGADAVGAIPHFEFTREYSVESLNFALQLAADENKLVDVHCDEIDDEASRGLETVAARALELGLYDKVTASHTTAMHSYNNAYVLRLMRLLKMSRINFVANPLVNTHLQGRIDTYPKRRGLTRVKELLAEGINVSFGHDDIFDPWYPMGNGSLRDVVFMGLHVGQMMGYEEIMNSYKLITYNAAKTLHISDNYGIAINKPASFIVLDAKNYYDA
ncbi:MAG: cytosine deaminase, partial [Erysipelotrichaceae bacterium]|nr:cytosine deaminase [Erysipelotrichaceae bacterium]